MVVTWLAADEAQIGTLAVENEHRRHRVGYRLICNALGSLLKLGASKVFLEVRASNSPAQSLYRRFGFQVMGRRPGYYKDGEDAILMELRELDKEHLETIGCHLA